MTAFSGTAKENYKNQRVLLWNSKKLLKIATPAKI